MKIVRERPHDLIRCHNCMRTPGSVEIHLENGHTSLNLCLACLTVLKALIETWDCQTPYELTAGDLLDNIDRRVESMKR